MDDEQMLGLEPAERVPGRGEPEEQLDANGLSAGGEELVRADRLGDDERACGGPPQRGLAPRTVAREADRLERAVRERVGDDEVRDAELRRDSCAVAVVPVEQLDDSSRTGSTSQTRASSASACEVRVAGSSTIHEKPASPRSSQSSILIAPA